MLPPSEAIGTGMWTAGDKLLVNPSLGSAGGGQVNNWGRRYPEGAMFDTDSLSWRSLPAASTGKRGVRSAGFVGSEQSLFFGSTGGIVLDVTNATWINMASAPGGRTVTRTVRTADKEAIAISGSQWDRTNKLKGVSEVWIWRP